MKKTLVLVCSLLLALSFTGCTGAQVKQGEAPPEQAQGTQNNEQAAVQRVVEEFGQKLQLVSLLGPEDALKESMLENYSNYVSLSLIEKWLADPLNAPGRLTSSPWPDRIEILGLEQISPEAYEVTGEIIEVTSADGKEIAAKRPVTLRVGKTDGKWIIGGVELGDYEDNP